MHKNNIILDKLSGATAKKVDDISQVLPNILKIMCEIFMWDPWLCEPFCMRSFKSVCVRDKCFSVKFQLTVYRRHCCLWLCYAFSAFQFALKAWSSFQVNIFRCTMGGQFVMFNRCAYMFWLVRFNLDYVTRFAKIMQLVPGLISTRAFWAFYFVLDCTHRHDCLG